MRVRPRRRASAGRALSRGRKCRTTEPPRGVSAHSGNDPSRDARCIRTHKSPPRRQATGHHDVTGFAARETVSVDHRGEIGAECLRRRGHVVAPPPEMPVGTRASCRVSWRSRRGGAVARCAERDVVHRRRCVCFARSTLACILLRLPPPLLQHRSRDHAPPMSVRLCGNRLLEVNPSLRDGSSTALRP